MRGRVHAGFGLGVENSARGARTSGNAVAGRLCTRLRGLASTGAPDSDAAAWVALGADAASATAAGPLSQMHAETSSARSSRIPER
jgi:hypothetical protein